MICEQCKRDYEAPKHQSGSKRRFCSRKCRTNHHNELKKKGAANLKKRLAKKAAPKKEPRFVDLGKVPVAERGNLLGGIAQKLGLTEGPLLKELRRQKAAGEPLTGPKDSNQYEVTT